MTGGSATQLNRVELGVREVGTVEEGKNARKKERMDGHG